VELLRNPAEWDTLDISRRFGLPSRTRFADVMPFWSKVEKLTIHDRTHINPSGGDPSTNSVTLIDVALSGGVCQQDGAMHAQCAKGRRGRARARDHDASTEMSAARTSRPGERDLLIKIILRDRLAR
jgi:hypothetical protein